MRKQRRRPASTGSELEFRSDHHIKSLPLDMGILQLSENSR